MYALCYRTFSTETDDPNGLCRNALNIERCDSKNKWSEYTVPYMRKKEKYRYCEAVEIDKSADEGDYNSCILEEVTKTS